MVAEEAEEEEEEAAGHLNLVSSTAKTVIQMLSEHRWDLIIRVQSTNLWVEHCDVSAERHEQRRLRHVRKIFGGRLWRVTRGWYM